MKTHKRTFYINIRNNKKKRKFCVIEKPNENHIIGRLSLFYVRYLYFSIRMQIRWNQKETFRLDLVKK